MRYSNNVYTQYKKNLINISTNENSNYFKKSI
jgi:hypothetical protein